MPVFVIVMIWVACFEVSVEGWPEIVGDYEVLFAVPTTSRAQALLARDLLGWVGEFETASFRSQIGHSINRTKWPSSLGYGASMESSAT